MRLLARKQLVELSHRYATPRLGRANAKAGPLPNHRSRRRWVHQVLPALLVAGDAAEVGDRATAARILVEQAGLHVRDALAALDGDVLQQPGWIASSIKSFRDQMLSALRENFGPTVDLSQGTLLRAMADATAEQHHALATEIARRMHEMMPDTATEILDVHVGQPEPGELDVRVNARLTGAIDTVTITGNVDV